MYLNFYQYYINWGKILKTFPGSGDGAPVVSGRAPTKSKPWAQTQDKPFSTTSCDSKGQKVKKIYYK